MYEKIKKILSTRDYVLVKSCNVYNVVCKSRDQYSLLINESWYKTKENSINIDSKKTLLFPSDTDDWQIIDVFDTPKEQFKEKSRIFIIDGRFKGKFGKILRNIYPDKYEVNVEIDEVKRSIETMCHNQLSYPFQEEKTKTTKFNELPESEQKKQIREAIVDAGFSQQRLIKKIMDKLKK